VPALVVLLGIGRVGRLLCEALSLRGVSFVASEQNRGIIEQLRARQS
jgi:Trk K+ transport system NAD-binding subunit